MSELRGLLLMVASTDPDEYLDVDDGSAAIAAAEIVAATLPHGRDRLTREGTSWLDANASGIGAEDVVLARRAVERVLARSSELRGMWDEGGIETEWHADVGVLLVRLGGDSSVVTPLAKDATQEEERMEGAAHVHSKQALLAFLLMRGLDATEEQRARIWASRDPEELRRWLGRIVTASSVSALLDE